MPILQDMENAVDSATGQINETISPRVSVWDRPSMRQEAMTRQMFVSGDPLSIYSPEERSRIEEGLLSYPNKDEELKKQALAQFYSRGDVKAREIVYGDINGAIKHFHGEPLSIDQAFAQVANIYNGQGEKYDAMNEGTVFGLRAKTGAGVAGGLGLVYQRLVDAEYIAQKTMNSVLSIFDTGMEEALDERMKEVTQDARNIRTFNTEMGGLIAPTTANKNLIQIYKENGITAMGEKMLGDALVSLPELGIMMLSGPFAIPYIGATTGASKYVETDLEHPDMGEDEKATNAVLTGALNALTFKLLTFDKVLGFGENFREPLKEGFKNALKDWSRRFAIQEGQMTAVGSGEWFIDKLTNYKRDDSFLEATGNSILGGALPSMMFAGMGTRNMYTRGVQQRENVRNVLLRREKELLAMDEAKMTDGEKAQLKDVQRILESNDMEGAIDVANVEYARMKLEERVKAMDEIGKIKDEKSREEERLPPEERMSSDELSAYGVREYLFRKSIKKHNPDDTIKAIQDYNNDFPGLEVKSYTDVNEIPQVVKDQARREGKSLNKINAFPYEGKVYVNATRVSPSHLPKLVLDEWVGHVGLRQVFKNKGWDQFLDYVSKAHSEDVTNWSTRYAPKKKDVENAYDITTESGRRRSAEEFLAHGAVSKIKPAKWKEILADFGMFLRKFFPAVRFTTWELEGILSKAYRQMQRKNAQEWSGFARFSYGQIRLDDLGFYSQLETVVDGMDFKNIPSRDLLNRIKNAQGIKAEELEWSGVEEFLASREKVSKDEIMQFLQAGGVKLEEVLKSDNPSDMVEVVQAKGPSPIWQIREKNGGRVISSGFHTKEDAVSNISKAVNFSGVEPGAKFSKYQLPNGENYRELLLTMPVKESLELTRLNEISMRMFGVKYTELTDDLQYGHANAAQLRVQVKRAYFNEYGERGHEAENRIGIFKSSHFSESNILAHVRFNERTDADGKRVLFIEEIQSDWHQQGRKHGYKGDAEKRFEDLKRRIESKYKMNLAELRISERSEEKMKDLDEIDRAYSEAQREKHGSNVPDAPFKTSWPMLAMKRMIRWAVENNFDRIAWTTGEQQAGRYDMSKQVDEILYRKNQDGTFEASAIVKGQGHPFGKDISPDNLQDYVGKEIAERINNGEGKEINLGGQGASQENYWTSLSGEGLKIGGEGMKGFYDKILPSEVNKYVKKWGAKVGETRVPIKDEKSEAGYDNRPLEIGDWSFYRNPQGGEPIWLRSDKVKAKAKELGVNSLEKATKEDFPITGTEPVHSLDITDTMREKVMQGQTRFSVEEDDIANWKSKLDAYKNGTLDSTRNITISKNTPLPLTAVGADDLPIVIAPRVIKKVTEEEHAVSIDELYKLVDNIYNPIAVFQSASIGDAFAVMTEMKENGKNVLVAVHLNVSEGRHEVNAIRSIYGKTKTDTLVNWVREGRMRFMDKEKLSLWFQSIGVQFPKEGTTRRANPNLITKDELVKLRTRLSYGNLAKWNREREKMEMGMLVGYLKEELGSHYDIIKGKRQRDIQNGTERDYHVDQYIGPAFEKGLINDPMMAQSDFLDLAFEQGRDLQKNLGMSENQYWEQQYQQYLKENPIVNSEQNQRDLQDMARALVPMAEKMGSIEMIAPESAMKFLQSKGFDIDDLSDAHTVSVMARNLVRDRHNRAMKKAKEKFVSDEYPILSQLIKTYGENVKIKPSPAYKGEYDSDYINAKRGKNTVSSDEASKKLNLDEEDIINELKSLKNTEIEKAYAKYKEDKVGRKGKMAKMKREAEDNKSFLGAYEIVRGSQELTDWIIKNNPKVAENVYRQVMGEPLPEKPDWETVKSRLSEGKSNRPETEKSGVPLQEFKKMQNALDRMLSAKNARELAQEMVMDMPESFRGAFAHRIEQMDRYTDNPTPVYPEGRRQAELDRLKEDINEYMVDYHRMALRELIGESLDKAQMQRIGKGRLVSVEGEQQAKIDKIRDISSLSTDTVIKAMEAYQEEINKKIDAGEDPSELQYEVAMLEAFGMLDAKSPQELQTVYTMLENIRWAGRDQVKEWIEKRRAEDAINAETAFSEIAGSLMEPQEERLASEKRGKNMLSDAILPTKNLEMMLSHITKKSKNLFKDTFIYKHYFMNVHKSAQAKKTNLRNRSDALRKEIDSLFGTTNDIKRAKLMLSLKTVQENSGVMRFQRDPNDPDKGIEYTPVTVEFARETLKEYEKTGKGLDEYQAEAIRQKLLDIDQKLKSKLPKGASGDEYTDSVLLALQKDRDDGKILVPLAKDPGKTREEPLSQLQALYVKLAWEQKNVRYKMFFNGWRESSIRQIDKFLLPEVKELGKWMVADLKKNLDSINDVYEKMYMTRIPGNENYFPTAYNVAKSLAEGKAELGAQYSGEASVTPGALVSRRFHLKDIRIEDAVSKYTQHVMEMEHFVTHAETARELRALYNNPKIQTAIRQQYGTETLKYLKMKIDDFINEGRKDVARDTFLDKAQSVFARSRIWYNTVSMMKQMVGTMQYINDIPVHAFAKGVGDFWLHPVENARMMAQTDYIKNRFGGGLDRDIAIMLSGHKFSAEEGASIAHVLDDVASLPVRFGDVVACITGGYAVYKYHLDQIKKTEPGISQAEAHKYAMTQWEMSTERTQQSGSAHMMNRYQLDGSFGKVFTTFQSNPILVTNALIESIGDVYHGRGTKAERYGRLTRRTMTAVMIGGLAMEMTAQIFRHGTELDEYEYTRLLKSMLNPFASLNYLGAGFDSALNALLTYYGDYRELNSTAMDDIGNAVRSSLRIIDPKKGELEGEDLWKAVEKGLLGIGYAGAMGTPGLGSAGAGAVHATGIMKELRRYYDKIFGEEKHRK